MIFPQLKGLTTGYVDLDRYARYWLPRNNKRYAEGLTGGRSPLLDPALCGQMIVDCHRDHSLHYSYGGWCEVRRCLWSGSYLAKTGNFMHLGVDFNVIAGTHVAIDHEAVVVKVDDDTPEESGWGNRVIVQLIQPARRSTYLIYAHLGKNCPLKLGDRLRPGEHIGVVGTSQENGGWFPHLHVQAVKGTYFEGLIRDNRIHDLDGYGHPDRVRILTRNFPDPLPYIRLE